MRLNLSRDMVVKGLYVVSICAIVGPTIRVLYAGADMVRVISRVRSAESQPIRGRQFAASLVNLSSKIDGQSYPNHVFGRSVSFITSDDCVPCRQISTALQKIILDDSASPLRLMTIVSVSKRVQSTTALVAALRTKHISYETRNVSDRRVFSLYTGVTNLPSLVVQDSNATILWYSIGTPGKASIADLTTALSGHGAPTMPFFVGGITVPLLLAEQK